MRTTSPDVFTRRIVCSSFFSFALVNTGCWVSRAGAVQVDGLDELAVEVDVDLALVGRRSGR